MGAEQGRGKTLRCAACGKENERDEPRCTKCGGPLRRRRRRGVEAESDTPFSGEVAEHNRPALRAYRLAVFGIVPAMGLVAGPIACVLGLVAWLRGRHDPHFTAQGPATAAVLLGAASGITNWVGFALMFRGLGWL